MSAQRGSFEQQLMRAVRRVTGGNVFEVTVTGLAVAFLLATIGATIRAGQANATADLSFDGTLDETSALIRNRGAQGIAVFVAGDDSGGMRPRIDSLRITGDSVLFRSLARGGFLRDQVDVYNDQAARVAVRNAFLRDGQTGSNIGTPSIFRLVRTDSGDVVLGSDLNEYSLSVPSPRRDKRWLTVLTADGGNGPSLVGMFSSISLTQRDSTLSVTHALSGNDCRVQRRGIGRLLYCGSAAGAAVGAAFDLGIDLPDSVEFGKQARARMSRGSAFYQNGFRAKSPAAVGAGDLLYTRATGPLVTSNTQTGVLASAQWLNGKPSFSVARGGTIQQLGRIGRSANAAGGGTVRLSVDATLSDELDARVDRFMAQHNDVLEQLSVIVADIGSGEIKGLSQSGIRDGAPLRAFEPVLFGSMVKPIMAASILSQDPSLASLAITYAGDSVRQVAGLPLHKAFRNPANGCFGVITLRLFIQCSSNQFAAELFIRSIQHSAKKAQLSPTGVVPNALLENTALTNGLLTTFDDVDVVSSRDPGRSDRIWQDVSGTTIEDRSMYPWKSRPWFIDARRGGTSVDLLSRFAFGGWENRWTQVGAAEAYARIATDRRVQLTMRWQPNVASRFEQMPPKTTRAFRAVRQGLADVVDHGTATGLGAIYRAIANDDTLAVLAKTGTLNEVSSRASDEDVFIKSLAVVVGKRAVATDVDSPMRCGVVAILHLEFRQDWRNSRKLSVDARLPDLHREFAEQQLVAALANSWQRMSPCPRPVFKIADRSRK